MAKISCLDLMDKLKVKVATKEEAVTYFENLKREQKEERERKRTNNRR